MAVGCGGMLGDAFYRFFNDKVVFDATDIDINESWLEELDFRDFHLYRQRAKEFKPDFLLHLGAFTDLEYCEQYPDACYETNTLSVENAVSICNELDICLLYISTAGIFDGKKEFYDDWDQPNPINIYGRSKFLGEEYIKQHSQRFFICRAGWMMGAGPKKDKKFVNKIARQIEAGAQELYVVDDKLGIPTYTHDFAKNVYALLQTPYFGLYNMVCNGEASRHIILTSILEELNIKDIAVETVSSGYFKEEYFANRPASEQLVNKKLMLRGLYMMNDWRQSLSEYLIECYPHLKR